MSNPRVLILCGNEHWKKFVADLPAQPNIYHRAALPAECPPGKFVGAPIEAAATAWDIILSLHWPHILPPDLVQAIPCYNIHPGYLPHGRGWHPVTWARANGHPAGASLHQMTEDVDAGPVIDRFQVPCNFEDTTAEVLKRVHEAEEQLLVKWWPQILTGEILRHRHTGQGSLVRGDELIPPTRTKADFAALSKLDLNERCTVRDIINRLAGLTIGPGESRAYVEDARGRKIRVGIFLEPMDASD